MYETPEPWVEVPFIRLRINIRMFRTIKNLGVSKENVRPRNNLIESDESRWRTRLIVRTWGLVLSNSFRLDTEGFNTMHFYVSRNLSDFSRPDIHVKTEVYVSTGM